MRSSPSGEAAKPYYLYMESQAVATGYLRPRGLRRSARRRRPNGGEPHNAVPHARVWVMKKAESGAGSASSAQLSAPSSTCAR